MTTPAVASPPDSHRGNRTDTGISPTLTETPASFPYEASAPVPDVHTWKDHAIHPYALPGTVLRLLPVPLCLRHSLRRQASTLTAHAPSVRPATPDHQRSEEHTCELQSLRHLV